MYCTECGNLVQTEANFCASCGAAVGVSTGSREDNRNAGSSEKETKSLDVGSPRMVLRGVRAAWRYHCSRSALPEWHSERLNVAITDSHIVVLPEQETGTQPSKLVRRLSLAAGLINPLAILGGVAFSQHKITKSLHGPTFSMIYENGNAIYGEKQSVLLTAIDVRKSLFSNYDAATFVGKWTHTSGETDACMIISSDWIDKSSFDGSRVSLPFAILKKHGWRVEIRPGLLSPEELLRLEAASYPHLRSPRPAS